MKYSYFINGITCGSCVEKITGLLKNQAKVTEILISDNNTKLSFVSNNDIDINKLNVMLAKIGTYKISELNNDSIPEDKISYKPIYLIFAYVIIVNVLVSYKHFDLNMFMPNFMASFFLVFSFFKMLDLQGFADGYSSYDLIAKKFYKYGFIYPFIEVVFGLSYILIPTNLYLNIVVFLVMLASALGVILAKFKKQKFYCACVGTFLKVPLGSIAIVEDLLMVLMSLFMIIHLTCF